MRKPEDQMSNKRQTKKLLYNSYKRLDECFHQKRLDDLKRELDHIERQYGFIPATFSYYVNYFFRKYRTSELYPYILKYIKAVPKERHDRSFYTNIVKLTSAWMYEGIFEDDLYRELMAFITESTIVGNTYAIRPANIHRFKKMKIGLMSSSFTAHPVGRFILSLLSTSLNYETTEYHIYDTRASSNPISDAIKTNSKAYNDVSKFNDDELAESIYKDGLDVLIDLNGSSDKGRLHILTRRLAPVQISYIGYPATTATRNVDYQIVDRISDPPDISRKYYTEDLLYMEKTFLCYACEVSAEDASYELPFDKNGHVTIGGFGNLHKYSDTTLRLWKRIMDLRPTVRFYIRALLFKNDDDVELQQERFRSFGVDTDRIDFIRQAKGFQDYFDSYHEVDLVLDTFPFNGATTTCDALSMSVPIITLAGHVHVSRVGASMLTNMGLPELIAYDEEDYVKKAIGLIDDADRLRELRQIIRKRFMESPLMDTLAFKIDFESKLRDAYIAYVRGLGGSDGSLSFTSPSDIANEALTSIFYMQNILQRHDNVVPRDVIEESYLVQMELYAFLRNSYTGNNNALNMLDKYKELLETFWNVRDNASLSVMLDTMLKVLGRFVS